MTKPRVPSPEHELTVLEPKTVLITIQLAVEIQHFTTSIEELESALDQLNGFGYAVFTKTAFVAEDFTTACKVLEARSKVPL